MSLGSTVCSAHSKSHSNVVSSLSFVCRTIIVLLDIYFYDGRAIKLLCPVAKQSEIHGLPG